MSLSTVQCPDIIIANGQTISNVLWAAQVYDDAVSLLLAALSTGDAAKTYKIQVTNSGPADASPSWFDLTDGTNLISAPVPNATPVATNYPLTGWRGFRIVASGAVAADTTWKVTKQIGMYQ